MERERKKQGKIIQGGRGERNVTSCLGVGIIISHPPHCSVACVRTTKKREVWYIRGLLQKTARRGFRRRKRGNKTHT